MAKPMTQEHKDKIAAALRRYNAGGGHLGAYRKAGPEHPNWKGGTAPRYYQRVAHDAHGHACMRCGSTHHVDVHHVDGDHGNSSAENLQPLCRSCHSLAHGKGGQNFKGGVAASYYRRVAFAAHGHRCAECGGTAGLVVRHLDGELSHSAPHNLRVYCRRCNYRLHGAGQWCRPARKGAA
jgi:5-methylcytosine-specific restriction endonuclease McrA